jgi:hypothetical protein
MNLRPLRVHFARRLLLPAALALTTLTCSGADTGAPLPPITSAGQEAMWWGDFAAIEQHNALYRQPGRTGADGVTELGQFRNGVATVFNYKVKNPESYMKELDAITLQWAKQHPDSGLAHALHARALMAHAHSYRGGTYAKDVPPEAWAPYNDYLKQAATYLKDHADVALTDSYAHYVLLNIGRSLGWERKQLAAILEDGLARNPEDDDLYFAMLEALLPKWGGDARTLDAYIRKAAEQTRARLGLGMYTRLYDTVADGQYGTALFEDSHADWGKMKQGYEDLLAKHPGSPKRLNRYAFMACVAKDKPAFLRVIDQVGANLRTDEWGSNPERAVETCRRWAAQADGAASPRAPATPAKPATAT